MTTKLDLMQLLDMLQIHVHFMSVLMTHCNMHKIDYELLPTFQVTLKECKKLKKNLDGHNIDTTAFEFLNMFPAKYDSFKDEKFLQFEADKLAERLL